MKSTPLTRLRAHRHPQPSARVLPIFVALGLLWLLVEIATRY